MNRIDWDEMRWEVYCDWNLKSLRLNCFAPDCRAMRAVQSSTMLRENRIGSSALCAVFWFDRMRFQKLRDCSCGGCCGTDGCVVLVFLG